MYIDDEPEEGESNHGRKYRYHHEPLVFVGPGIRKDTEAYDESEVSSSPAYRAEES
jgi:hypothetical protein